MTNQYKLVHNQSKNRFEFHVDGFTPHIEYMKRNNKIYLNHTRVPEELEGQGVGSSLVKAVFKEIEDKQLKIVPVCDFIKSYLQRHPEWNHLLSESDD